MPYGITCMWNPKYDTNELTYETERDSQTYRRNVVADGEGSRGGMDWEFGISRCKLSCIGRINSKAQLYIPRNYIQNPVIDHNGKEYLKRRWSESESCSVVSDSLWPHGMVHGILQVRTMECVAFPFSGDLHNPGIEPRSPALQVDSLPAEPQECRYVCNWATLLYSRN